MDYWRGGAKGMLPPPSPPHPPPSSYAYAGDLVLGSVTGTYYSLFLKVIREILTVTPSLFNQNRHNISATRYKSETKNGHDWSLASSPVRSDAGLIRIQLQKHSSSIRTNRANRGAVFEGSPVRYNTAYYLY